MNGAYNIGSHEASVMMPMHLVVDADGRIIGAGPVMERPPGEKASVADVT